MLYPKNKKCLEPSVSTAAGYFKHTKTDLKLPENIIMCPVSVLTKTAANNYKTKHLKLDGHDVYLFEGKNAAFVTNYGQGAPAHAMMMEGLIALGGRNFVLTGIAGSLQKNLHAGAVVLCNAALRDEGVSPNYIPQEDFAYPSKTLTAKIAAGLEKRKTDFFEGATWTTDTLYRETAGEIAAYQKAGIMTVEMEASAAFAIAAHHKVKCSAVFTVSDSLANLKWEPSFGSAEIKKSMIKILEALVSVFG